MRIAILQSSYEGSNSPFLDFDSPAQPAIFAPLNEANNYKWTTIWINKETVVKQVSDLVKSKEYDLFFNLCDGAPDEDKAGVEVVNALQKFNAPYTGAGPKFYGITKENMKMASHRAGVCTPAHAFIYDVNAIDEVANDLSFPMIVKHFDGYGSVGMTKNSRVTNKNELYNEVSRMISLFGGALIEEFIEGKEFTVLIAENPNDSTDPIAFHPIEVVFPKDEDFKHFDLKWISFDDMKWKQVDDAELTNRIKEIGKKIFKALGGNSYGRCDFRMNNATGELYFLECNANCGIFYPPGQFGSADYILDKDTQYGHWGFIKLLIQCAFKSHQQRQKKYAISFKKNSGYGLIATKDIMTGETVVEFEETPFTLVSKQHIEKNWDELKKQWFTKYAYPLSDNLYVIWSDNPSEWKPINHSCDPNTWLDGLSLIARKSISKGDAITIDYATMYAVNMESFKCCCDSLNCRSKVTSKDYLKDSIIEKYGDEHVSDFIRMKRFGNDNHLTIINEN